MTKRDFIALSTRLTRKGFRPSVADVQVWRAWYARLADKRRARHCLRILLPGKVWKD